MMKIEKTSATSGKMDVYISEESIITGDLQTKSSIKIEGHVQGNVIAAGNVHIGGNAKVDGNITGMDIQIAGVANGNISANGELVLFASGKVGGDVKAAAMTIERGAFYKGNTVIGAEPAKDVPKEAKKA
jgi:cytoskeletal protein CcmA (bactofilin family)